ncbi:hypothetical protein E0Z10_g3654 [Xylaria hypoxylon]|uniref:Uncharacterized protein n=1 Tax=Xylaria hypoxylon TaxID=37992 RepID=A0A4Z0YLE4_9PEZI|nr:hypothetical protein E0Z10_g3654 [Xylaria hypoxylon]
MSDDHEPTDSVVEETDKQRPEKSDQPDNKEASGGRPKYVSTGTSRFAVNDSVYHQVGTTLYGPYLVAKVCRPQVYMLCDANGDYINNGTEFIEVALLKSRMPV